jgi:hypothetical protein
MVNKTKAKTLLEWEPINERLIKARFDSRFTKLTVLQCYAPTNDADKEDKDDFYEQLQLAVSRVSQHDTLMILGDLNAKVGSDNSICPRTMGKHGCGNQNDNGERLVSFCSNNNYVIGGTIFPHKDIHKLTWTSPDGRTVNQIDHVIVNYKWRRSLQDVRVYRGADANSDHYLLIAEVKTKLRKALRPLKRKRLDISRLRDPTIKEEFSLELRNRFSALADLTQDGDQEEAANDGDDPAGVQEKWDNIKKVYLETAEKVVGYKKRKNKEWITEVTWKKINERKRLKDKVLCTKSPRLQEHAKQEYRAKDREVKRSARRDRRAFLENLASEAETAVVRCELSTVYKITKQLCGRNSRQSVPVKAKDGSALPTEREQAARWVEHFQEVLNRPEPDEPADPNVAGADLDIDISPPSRAEVRKAISLMKSGKAPGVDGITSEFLKADIEVATDVLHNLFTAIWSKEALPDDWEKGLLTRIAKKGDLRSCDNWRGVTLLSIPSKVFCRILLNRIDAAIDSQLREEQAGFRRGRGCIDQIFALRNIIEQCIEWNTPLFINFIDFRKAFDSVHRESLWKILRSYGIPQKFVTLISKFYDNFECSVILDDSSISDSFPVKSGVRQGCILSPILFLLVIDWIQRKSTADKVRGIQWNLFSHLEDLDFADDLAELSPSSTMLQEKTDKLTMHAKTAGLTVNSSKTKTMSINATRPASIQIEGEDISDVNDFTYLGSVVSNASGTGKDIQARLAKARGAFAQLQPVWRSNQYSVRTKLRLYGSNVKSVLLYGSECWRAIKSEMKKVESFHNGCLRKILRIFWPNKVSNADLYRQTGSRNISVEIKQRRMRWLGHVFRMPMSRIPKVALRWSPPGKRRQGRPRTTWRRTAAQELLALGLTWEEAQNVARDKARWRGLVAALCPTRDEED